MSFEVDKTLAGVTNFSKLHNEVDDDAAITTTFEGLSYTGSTVSFQFAGAGPLSSSENTALDAIVAAFTNDETNNDIASTSGYNEYSAYLGTTTTDATWTTMIVSAAPANSIIDIAIETEGGRFAGVRSCYSNKDRKFYIDNTMVVMRVVTDSSSQIEVYASDKTQVFYTLIGVAQ